MVIDHVVANRVLQDKIFSPPASEVIMRGRHRTDGVLAARW